MKKIITVGLMLAAFTTAAIAGAIADRQQVMQSFNAAGAALRPMAMGTAPFDAAVAKTHLQAIVDGAAKLPSLIPPGSDVQGADDPKASAAQPVVWSDTATFLANASKLGADAQAAMAATDQASFATAWQTVNGDCGGCHRTFRAQAARGAGAGGPPGGGAGRPAQ